MRDATAAYAPLVAEGVIAGIHFEGPYLSAARCGAQNPAYLRDPSTEELAALIELGGGAVRMVTLAPERPARWRRSSCSPTHGVVAAIGHTDATYEQTRAGCRRRRAGRHAPLQRHAAAAPPRARPGVRPARRAQRGLRAGRRRRAPARRHAGVRRRRRPARTAPRWSPTRWRRPECPTATTSWAARRSTVADRVARLARGGSIAGSTLTMDAALRQAVGAGISIVDVAGWPRPRPAARSGSADRRRAGARPARRPGGARRHLRVTG